MKKNILLLFLVGILVSVAFVVGRFTTSSDTEEFSIIPTPVPTPLAKYSIPNMEYNFKDKTAVFSLVKVIKEEKNFTSYEFKMEFDPTFEGKTIKSVTGLLNVPNDEGRHPLILMIRGYVDPHIYTTGVGTKNGGEYFSNNGYITIAPDFLGYADSDQEAGNIFESRFQTYTTVLTLLNTFNTSTFKDIVKTWDQENLFMWAHSNGGQIALTVLSTTQLPIPTVLWAPVSKPFPYSVLYYTDESADGGKLIRRELAKFEALYDVNEYSFTNYLDNIKSPIEFEQGTADDAVPFTWTRSISTVLKNKGLDITYNEYPGSDHNLRPAWNTVVEKNLNFYAKHLKPEQ